MWWWTAAVFAAAIYCIARSIADLRSRRYVWGVPGLVSGAALLLTPMETHAVKLDVPVTAAADPNEHAILEQAERCGIKPEQLIWEADGAGRRKAIITSHGDLDSLLFKSVWCLIEWARKTGANVGFASEAPDSSSK